MCLKNKIEELSPSQMAVFINNTDVYAIKLFLDLEIDDFTNSVISDFNELSIEERNDVLSQINENKHKIQTNPPVTPQ